MRILLACEYSAVCREAFKRKGWEAWSCDLKKTNVPGNHIQGDVLEIIDDDWDMIIGFPPCTYLSATPSNLYRLPERIEKKIKPGRLLPGK